MLVALLGMTGVFAYNVLFFKGLRLIEAGRASLIVATCPAFIAVASALFLATERSFRPPSGRRASPCPCWAPPWSSRRATCDRILAGGVGLGELFILGCVLSWVAYSLIGKVAMRRLSPLVAVSYSSAVGALALAVPAIDGGPRQEPRPRLLDRLGVDRLPGRVRDRHRLRLVLSRA